MRGGRRTDNANITDIKEIWKQFLKKYGSDLKKMVTMRGVTGNTNISTIIPNMEKIPEEIWK